MTDLDMRSLKILEMGGYGVMRIGVETAVAGAGDFTTVSRFVSLQGITATNTYGATCVTDITGADVPASGDDLPKGTIHIVNLTTVVLSAGAAFALFIPRSTLDDKVPVDYTS